MAVKLFNKSKVPDKALKDVLTAAKRYAGCPGDTVVKVGESHRATSGIAYEGWPYYWHLTRKRIKGTKARKRLIKSGSGWFEIKILLHHLIDPLQRAEAFFRVAVHEFTHVRDYGDWRQPFDRSLPYRRRPEEIRARNAARDADSRRSASCDEKILTLALALEELQKPRSEILEDHRKGKRC